MASAFSLQKAKLLIIMNQIAGAEVGGELLCNIILRSAALHGRTLSMAFGRIWQS